MTPRGSTTVFAVWGGLFALLGGCLVHAACAPRDTAGAQALVARLGLTDIALLNEARYTRNPALADLHAPFQDGPGSFDHFPSGSLFSPHLALGGRIETVAP
jgi:hypothetical protein